VEQITFNFRTGQTRRVIESGREYLVAPMTTITADGVLPGSKGALFYPKSETANSTLAWNGTPIVVKHPTKDGRHVSAMEVPEQHIGELRNSALNDRGHLIHEGWFDAERTKRADKRVYDALIHHKPMEISTGLYTTNVPARNGHEVSPHGRPYTAIATRYQPDHLAMLPDEVGACSLNDGCGLMINARRDEPDCPT
jgi:hypothetical protein